MAKRKPIPADQLRLEALDVKRSGLVVQFRTTKDLKTRGELARQISALDAQRERLKQRLAQHQPPPPPLSAPKRPTDAREPIELGPDELTPEEQLDRMMRERRSVLGHQRNRR